MNGQAQRVLQVSRSVIQGGFDYHVEIARAFEERGVRVLTVFQRGLMSTDRAAAFPGSVVFLDAGARRVYKRPSVLAGVLWRASRGAPYDLALCHHVTPGRAVAHLMRFGRARRAALVVHDYDYFDPNDRHGRRRKRFLTAAMHRRRGSWGVVGVSRAICTNVRAQVPAVTEDRCSVIHNAMDVEALERELVPRARARRELGFDESAFLIGTVGRLIPFKAHDDLIASFARVHGETPDARLVLVGRGPLESRLRAQIRAEGLEDKVQMVGFLDRAARYMSAFDVFVLPSHNEPFGLVLLEAMAARLPIIASDSGATREILPDEALVYPNGDRDALAACLAEVCRMPSAEHLRIGELGYRRARDTFSLERYRAAYAGLLPSSGA